MILTSKSQFQRCLEVDNKQQYIAKYNELVLSSVYQPIFDLRDEIIGVEALVRIKDSQGNAIRPDLFFSSDSFSTVDKVNVERLSRVIHIRNFSQSDFRAKKLFLNVLPIAGEMLAVEDLKNGLLIRRLRNLNLKSSQLVMELIELNCLNEDYLKIAMSRLKENGFNVAIDDYGVCASNQARVNAIEPHIIKLDRSLLVSYCEGDKAPLLDSIQVAKRVNATTVIEGIETEEQLNMMRALNIDMYQGFYLAIPEPLPALSATKAG
ncbi:EAL domain-containing protein [Vibrio atypicus]|jgi:EAL domain-containing protein (putative c-di-GMP-specific phosphodiesterase class I)|uniref:EAL domain-containing protein n=1 Tax=Vibrio atypicus TaxID=558271 RepID=UPI00135C185F|nr:EAL domain-containing protein [Vibrio atypicus]